jgi:hypothetical protein
MRAKVSVFARVGSIGKSVDVEGEKGKGSEDDGRGTMLLNRLLRRDLRVAGVWVGMAVW